MHDPLSLKATRQTVWHDTPLPGLHSCLTWQWNLTVHPFLDTCKFVSILRDPDAQVELCRAGSDGLYQARPGLVMARTALTVALAQLRDLAGVPPE